MALKAVLRTTGDPIADRRFAYASAAFVDADWRVAADLAAQTLELTPGFAPAHALLGRAHAALGEREPAAEALKEALRLDPDDELGVRIDLAQLGAAAPGEAISDGYVRALFDAYADSFDQHLTGPLAYRGPEVVMGELKRACAALRREPRFGVALDLGCGTGLMAKALDGAAKRVEGFDLSPKMVAVAARTMLYAALSVGDIVDELDRRPEKSADLALAADVLVYIGDLFPLFGEVARVLKPGGLFAFTVQAGAGHGFTLGVDARYAHAEEYLRTVADASGFTVARFAKASTRQERGLDVPGFVMVLAKA
jgi:predicted TPR repeat methyltransferase